MTEDEKLAKLLETQISLTEWLAKIGHTDAAAMREEDNFKRVRLGEIHKITGLPFDQPTTFEAIDLVNQTTEFKKFLAERGDELCALRLNPKKGADVEKIRNRGRKIKDAMKWFETLSIDATKYTADFVPHVEGYSWATIFIVNDKGIFGEIHFGGHHVLTQGFSDGKPPTTFAYDFKTWALTPANKDAEAYLKSMIEYIHITDPNTRAKLVEAVGAEFTHDYIKGYFETTHSKTAGTWVIDYNRVLGKRYADYDPTTTHTADAISITKGRVAGQGEASGVVKIVADPLADTLEEGEILVCAMTTPDFIPHMVKAAGIITDQGGILCHAAIVARELGKPCIVGTGNATLVLKNGDKVRLDTQTGEVVVINS